MRARILDATQWRRRAEAHRRRADELTAGHRARRSTGTRHAIEDFLYDYYGTRPSALRRWHPGVGVALAPEADGTPAPHTGWRWYATDAAGRVSLDLDRFLADRRATITFVRDLLAATASRPAFTGCFGLHEWAMVYRQAEHRHPLPLRLGQAGTDAVVEAHQIRCTHFDAFRFFTAAAVPRNRIQPTRAAQTALEQPGCLHAAMDCFKWAGKLRPAVPGDLLLDCFELAGSLRRLDMRASPYDLSAYGEAPIAVETAEGKAAYAARQRELTGRAADLRARLLEVCHTLLGDQLPDRRAVAVPAM